MCSMMYHKISQKYYPPQTDTRATHRLTSNSSYSPTDKSVAKNKPHPRVDDTKKQDKTKCGKIGWIHSNLIVDPRDSLRESADMPTARRYTDDQMLGPSAQ